MRKYWPLLFIFISCACAKYQVVQEVRVNMYHMHHPRKGVEIILTQDTLEIGKWYRLKGVKQYDIEIHE